MLARAVNVALDVAWRLSCCACELGQSWVLGMPAEEVSLEVPLVSSSVRTQRAREPALARVSYQMVFKVLAPITTLEPLATHRALKSRNGCCPSNIIGPMQVTLAKLAMGAVPHPSRQLS